MHTSTENQWFTWFSIELIIEDDDVEDSFAEQKFHQWLRNPEQPRPVSPDKLKSSSSSHGDDVFQKDDQVLCLVLLVSLWCSPNGIQHQIYRSFICTGRDCPMSRFWPGLAQVGFPVAAAWQKHWCKTLLIITSNFGWFQCCNFEGMTLR